jgi:hypothetical protein
MHQDSKKRYIMYVLHCMSFFRSSCTRIHYQQPPLGPSRPAKDIGQILNDLDQVWVGGKFKGSCQIREEATSIPLLPADDHAVLGPNVITYTPPAHICNPLTWLIPPQLHCVQCPHEDTMLAGMRGALDG